MSRIGRQPIDVPDDIEVEVKKGLVRVKGPKGELTQAIRPEVEVVLKDSQILVKRKTNSKIGRSLHGLTRTLIANMIVGVKQGWQKTLKLVGTGYRVAKEGDKLVFSLGFSHPVEIKAETGIELEVQGKDTVIVSGADKGQVGQVAAKIRNFRPPEVYKGKGIRYEGEQIKLKPGKAAKAGAAEYGGPGGS